MDWSDVPQVEMNPEIVHGAPVFKGTRLPVDSALESYYAYRELEDLADQQAIEATLEDFPTIPNGAEGLRSVLAYEAAQQHQFAS